MSYVVDLKLEESIGLDKAIKIGLILKQFYTGYGYVPDIYWMKEIHQNKNGYTVLEHLSCIERGGFNIFDYIIRFQEHYEAGFVVEFEASDKDALDDLLEQLEEVGLKK